MKFECFFSLLGTGLNDLFPPVPFRFCISAFLAGSSAICAGKKCGIPGGGGGGGAGGPPTLLLVPVGPGGGGGGGGGGGMAMF